MAIEDLGQAALAGWRAKAADALAGPLEQRTPLSTDQVRAAVGAAFFALSCVYVFGTIKRALDQRG